VDTRQTASTSSEVAKSRRQNALVFQHSTRTLASSPPCPSPCPSPHPLQCARSLSLSRSAALTMKRRSFCGSSMTSNNRTTLGCTSFFMRATSRRTFCSTCESLCEQQKDKARRHVGKNGTRCHPRFHTCHVMSCHVTCHQHRKQNIPRSFRRRGHRDAVMMVRRQPFETQPAKPG